MKYLIGKQVIKVCIYTMLAAIWLVLSQGNFHTAVLL